MQKNPKKITTNSHTVGSATLRGRSICEAEDGPPYTDTLDEAALREAEAVRVLDPEPAPAGPT
jgi:hypothetical protein